MGTAFAAVLADAGTDVVVHGRRREIVEAINTRHENPVYLPGITLPTPRGRWPGVGTGPGGR